MADITSTIAPLIAPDMSPENAAEVARRMNHFPKLALFRRPEEIVAPTNFGFGPLAAALDLTGVEFKQKNGQYQSASDGKTIVPGVVNDDSIKNISIETNGEKRYFEQVAWIDGHKGSKDSGCKANAWVEIDKDGKPLLNESGRYEVTYFFQGYNGNPLEPYNPAKNIDRREADTKSLHQVGRGELSDQIKEISGFMDVTEKAIAKKYGGQVTPSNSEAKVVGSSIGSANAIKAVIELNKRDIPVTDTVLLEPVAASLAGRLLGKQEGEALLGRIADNAVAVRTVNEDTLTNCAHLKTHKGEEKGIDRELAYEPQRNRNNSIGLNGNPQERNKVDPDNAEFVTKAVYVDVTGGKLFGVIDKPHTLGSIDAGLAWAGKEPSRMVGVKLVDPDITGEEREARQQQNREEAIKTLKKAREGNPDARDKQSSIIPKKDMELLSKLNFTDPSSVRHGLTAAAPGNISKGIT